VDELPCRFVVDEVYFLREDALCNLGSTAAAPRLTLDRVVVDSVELFAIWALVCHCFVCIKINV
jgi:hypothetical protein